MAPTENEWRPDPLLAGFEVLELPFPDDYDGRVVATLVRLSGNTTPNGAVLYVHGFIDYFFQRHMAERFAAEGYAFHALDLRKHGRSLRPHQHPNFCKSVGEYYADITRALSIIGKPTMLAGHSTGGLLCSLYAHEGERRRQVNALWLNSPFFDFKVSGAQRLLLVLASAIGRLYPFLNEPRPISPTYPKSIHKDYRGEWEFDLDLKPLHGFPAYHGWFAAIRGAQKKVRAGIAISCPVLSMHSDEADIVLDWRDIAHGSHRLGKNVTVLGFPGGLHDLTLSKLEIREQVFAALFAWLKNLAA